MRLNRAKLAQSKSRGPQIEVRMTRRLISTGSPFEKTAGYSRALIDGDFAFVSGTTGYDYATMTMPADVTSQTRNCFKTIERALTDGGFALADVVRATYYITDAGDATPCSRFAAKSLAISGRLRRCSSSQGSTSPR